MIYVIIAIVLGALGLVSGLFAFLYCFKVALVYDTFNKNIKSWSSSLDDTTQDAINRAARNILRELDERITNKDDSNDLNFKENE